MTPIMLDDVIATYRTIEIGGATYKVGRLNVREMAQLQTWLRQHVPHPVAEIKPHLEGLDRESKDRLLDMAYRDGRTWPPRFDSPEGIAILVFGDGQPEFIRTLLARCQPDVTLERAAEIAAQILPEQMGWLVKVATGQDPEVPEMDGRDDVGPKAPAVGVRPGRPNGDGSSTRSADAGAGPTSRSAR